MVVKDEEFAVMLVVQYVTYSSPSQLCNRISPRQESGTSSWALHPQLLEEVEASKTEEFGEDVLLDGHLSVAFLPPCPLVLTGLDRNLA